MKGGAGREREERGMGVLGGWVGGKAGGVPPTHNTRNTADKALIPFPAFANENIVETSVTSSPHQEVSF